MLLLVVLRSQVSTSRLKKKVMGPNPNVVRDGVVQKEFVINAQDPKAMKTVNTDRKYTQVGTVWIQKAIFSLKR